MTDRSATLRWALGLALALSLWLGAAAEAQAAEIVHVIQKGQNLGMIARRYHTSVDAVRKKNGLGPKSMLKPGQQLVIDETDEHAKWRAHYQRTHGKSPKETRRGEEPAPRPRARKRPTPRKRPAARNSPAQRSSAKRSETAKERKGKPASRDATPAKRSSESEGFARAPKRPGYVILVRQGKSFRGQLVDHRGRTIAKSTKKVDKLLRSRRTAEEHRISRKLLSMLAEVSDHFGGRTVIVVSGFRPASTNRFTRDSRHNHGNAIDFSIVGVPNRVVFERCKRFRNVGCGYYPNSHFVHMDVRTRKTQWVDYSSPGQAPIYAHRQKKRKDEDAKQQSGSTEERSGAPAPEPDAQQEN